MMTETEMKVKRVSGCHELNLTPKLVQLCEENMELVPLPEYTSDELTFAKKLQETVEKERLNTDMEITGSKLMANKILKAGKMGNKASAGSTDAGDVSMIMPMQFFNVACWPLGCALHSWQTTSAAGSTLGHKGMMYAAQVLSGIMFDLYSSEELFGQVVESFNEVKKEYICPLDQPMK